MSQPRILELVKTQCRIFSLNFNPQRLRLGNKILRQRLRGPALAAWYPKKDVSFRDLQNTYKPLGLTTFDEAEDDREEAIQMYVYRMRMLFSKVSPIDFILQCQIARKGTAQKEENRSRIEIREEEEINPLPHGKHSYILQELRLPI
ncbi:hypothetical protein N7533_001852 [Penicillium manginii]|uniref:uncharacterized protein n=1 Tax=Penicillium manginii TaxID=203109 RepID=UPI0025478B58|nr:uncharacterized protein N7533_001852 [Penicillium manginii]KAJ5763171.1 hypothetical protein N7533_001852 [Penicillium manginii]